MGLTLRATCACGYEGFATVGGGMCIPEGRRWPIEYKAALCLTCRELQSINRRSRKPRCENCGATTVVAYEGNPAMERLVSERPRYVRKNARAEAWAGAADYVYRCPRCDEMRMRMEDWAVWD